jgi:hypothetical protein
MVDVVPISIAPTPNLLHHNNVGITYAKKINFIMEPIRSIPLYFVAMPHSMVRVIEAPFTTALAHTIPGMKFRPQTLKGTNLVSMHTEMPKEVDMIFVRKPLNPGGGRGS